MVQDVSTSNNNDQNCLTLRQSPDSHLALGAPLPGNDVIPENIDSATSSQSQAFKELDLVGSQKWGDVAEQEGMEYNAPWQTVKKKKSPLKKDKLTGHKPVTRVYSRTS